MGFYITYYHVLSSRPMYVAAYESQRGRVRFACLINRRRHYIYHFHPTTNYDQAAPVDGVLNVRPSNHNDIGTDYRVRWPCVLFEAMEG